MKIKTEELREIILSLPRPAIVAISGFGGSGKSTLAGQLGEELGAPVVSVDSFTRNRLKGGEAWSTMDFKRFESEVLKPFLAGQDPISHGHYDWGENGIIKTNEVHHDGLLIVEGVGLFRPELLRYFAYKVWVDVPLEEAIARGKKRDREVHKNPQDSMWDGDWKRNDLEFLEKYKPQEVADLVVENGAKVEA